MTAPKVRVLVVDDSAFARKVLREILQADSRIELVGTARDGLDALEKIDQLAPDVVTLDLVMPDLDGLGVLAELRVRANASGTSATGRPRVVAVSMSDAESELGLAALDAGAVDLVHKPTAIATDRLYELGAELIAKVLIAAGANAQPTPPAKSATPPTVSRRTAQDAPTRTRLVLVGASTGGPQAITRLIGDLPTDFPVPIALVLHMPPGYTKAIAERLSKQTSFDVVEGDDGTVLTRGRIVVARAGVHLKIDARGTELVCRLDPEPLGALHRPSVDELFASAAVACGDRALGVILTGMGFDGLEGARKMRALGSRLLSESASSAVVDGMPRVVREAGLSFRDVPLDEMAAAVVAAL